MYRLVDRRCGKDRRLRQIPPVFLEAERRRRKERRQAWDSDVAEWEESDDDSREVEKHPWDD